MPGLHSQTVKFPQRKINVVKQESPVISCLHLMNVLFIGSDDYHEKFHKFIELFNILLLRECFSRFLRNGEAFHTLGH